MKNLVDAKWLYENINNVVIVDASSNFLVAGEGKEKYAQGHIPGAFHMDLDEDMCGTKGAHGGRHPLPNNMRDFADKLENIGVNNDSTLVVYDEGAMYASRFWWMCKYIGIENIKVLDGGIGAWKAAGYAVSSNPALLPAQKGKIDIRLQEELYVDINDIRRILADDTGKSAIVDSRPNERYKGENETVDPEAGHIPGAFNYFFGEVLDENGKYRDAEFLRRHYRDLAKYEELILHCGSGVSGSVNILALDEIDIPSKYYVGSWSDYITYEDAIIVVEN